MTDHILYILYLIHTHIALYQRAFSSSSSGLQTAWHQIPTLWLTQYVVVVFSCWIASYSLWPHGLWPIRLLCPWDFPDKNTGVVGCALLQGIFPNQGSNPGLLHYRQSLYHLSHQGSPKIMECVTYPFSRGNARPRKRTGVSCIAGRFFTSWATMEAPKILLISISICHLVLAP